MGNQEHHSQSRGTKAQFALFLSVTVNTAGQSFFLIILPPLGRRLGFLDIQTGAILSISALLLMLSAPAWGYLSERIGRRLVLLIALAAAAAAAAAYGSIVEFRLAGVLSAVVALRLFVTARAAQALVAGGLLPAAQAYMADITPPGQRASGMGVLGSAIGLGAIVGAAFAWQVAGYNPVLAFALVAVFAALAFAVVFLLIQDSVGHTGYLSSDVGVPLRKIWPFLAITVIAIAAYSILQQVTALRLQDALGFTSEESISRAGAALMTTALAMIVVQACAIRIFRWAPERLLGAGSMLAVFSMLMCSVATTYEEIFGTLVLLGIGLGLMLPGNLASLSLRTGSGAQGKVAGFNVVAQGLGQAIGPLAGAALHQMSPRMPYLAATVLFAVACGFALLVWRSERRAVTE